MSNSPGRSEQRTARPRQLGTRLSAQAHAAARRQRGWEQESSTRRPYSGPTAIVASAEKKRDATKAVEDALIDDG